jgi:tripartite-type tricarboxylate transporter receptor subunit TctC
MHHAIRGAVRTLAAIAAAVLTVVAAAHAQSDFPVKPVRLVVPFPAGGSTDIVGRIVAQKLGDRLGQQVVVENRGGAGGTIGSEAAAKAAPDGYTLLVGTTSTHAVAPSAYARVGYDPVKDFVAIAQVAVTPYLLVVNPAVKATTLAEFLALAKAQPGKLNYASAGNGTTTHLAMEMLKDAAGVDLVHVPYKGNAPADLAILGGEVQALFGSMPALLQNARAGKVRSLAVGTQKRSPALPDVPTVAESGFPGFEAALWLGVFAPAGTPAPIVERLQRELAAIALQPDFIETLAKNGAEPAGIAPQAFPALVREELGRYNKVVKKIGLKLD